jgi:hypothetical protein
MRGKTSLAIAIVAILIASTLVGYYLEFGRGTSKPAVQTVAPSLVYDFNSTIVYNPNGPPFYYGGSFLGWNTSGYVTENETDAVAIHYPGSISREFTALSSKVSVSFDWTEYATIIISRQLNGVNNDLTYSYSSNSELAYTNATSFNVDNGTTFTVRFESSLGNIAFIYRVKLWAANEYT